MKSVCTLISIFILYSSLLHCGSAPFSRGVNLTNWFQAGSARQVHFSKYTKKDFENIKSLGCDVIRLPVSMHSMTSGAPDYTVDPLLLTMLDEPVRWAEELQMHLILDNHSFDPAVNTDPNIWKVLVPVWKQLAQHFQSRSTLISYEILNEPHGISDVVWNTIQKMVIDSIRSIDTKHTIVVGPAGWNSYNNLNAMPVYADTNLIYTFHFYDPFIFTHQGATWSGPSLEPLSGIPFPYDAARMPAVPAQFMGTWIQTEMNNYSASGTVLKLQQILDIAVNFKKDRKVKIFCGEFGVYKPNSVNEDRVRWYDAVRKYLELNDIAWTIWDYQGGFGLFTPGTSEMFDHHLNIPLLSALGLNVPPQSPFTVRPDSIPIELYNDFIGPGILPSSSSGDLDLFSSGQFNGRYCIRWANAPQYQNIGFDFVPDKDLSLLKTNSYRLSLRVKSSSSGLSFHVRFIDSKTGVNDHPWRMHASVTGSAVPWNGEWQILSIPLSAMTEQGSWDSIWYNPIGVFDWKAIDRFEIVAEQTSLAGKELWLDDIRIVPAFASVAGAAEIPHAFRLLQNFPNPFNPSTAIRFDVPEQTRVTVQIYSMLGQLIDTVADDVFAPGSHQVEWHADAAAGIYLCRMTANGFSRTQKLVLMK
jgi:endoglucanase